MGWLLFVDEPSDDQSDYPHAVLTGIAILDVHIWTFVRKLHVAQDQFFGKRLIDSAGFFINPEALLGRHVYETAARKRKPSAPPVRRVDAEAAPYVDESESQHLISSAQAKIDYSAYVLSLAKDFGAVAFAMFFPTNEASLELSGQLRKDYAYLFERYFYLIDRSAVDGFGMVAFPETPRGRTRVSRESIEDYFTKTTNGRLRARKILPSPLYVGGALTVMSHLAELVAYVASWSIRLPNMVAERRSELGSLAALCNALRFSYQLDNGQKDWSFKFIVELSPADVPGGKRRRTQS